MTLARSSPLDVLRWHPVIALVIVALREEAEALEVVDGCSLARVLVLEGELGRAVTHRLARRRQRRALHQLPAHRLQHRLHPLRRVDLAALVRRHVAHERKLLVARGEEHLAHHPTTPLGLLIRRIDLLVGGVHGALEEDQVALRRVHRSGEELQPAHVSAAGKLDSLLASLFHRHLPFLRVHARRRALVLLGGCGGGGRGGGGRRGGSSRGSSSGCSGSRGGGRSSSRGLLLGGRLVRGRGRVRLLDVLLEGNKRVGRHRDGQPAKHVREDPLSVVLGQIRLGRLRILLRRLGLFVATREVARVLDRRAQCRLEVVRLVLGHSVHSHVHHVLHIIDLEV
mmetsp:Transcript_3206/g.6554  ORF Transcript_3206/g.6554 Transcript_3206/m.6554 type:complete len:340 (-) Transcript_3206:203-1222(-)